MRHLEHKTIMVAWLLAAICAAGCTQSDAGDWKEPPITTASADTTLHRYSLNMALSLASQAATRAAAYQWAVGDSLFLLFQSGGNSIYGVARCKQGTVWEVVTRGVLPEAEEAKCSAAFFIGATTATAAKVGMSTQTCAYTDDAAVWSNDDGTVTVTGSLLPLTGRVRFRGQPQQQFTLSGLAFMTSFSPATHVFASQPEKFTATVGSDGYSPYYYATFANADKRRLVFELSATTGLARNFGSTVLLPGQSGSIAIPTAESHDGWTLVNLGTDGEIVLPALSAVTTTSIRSKQATLAATVTSKGGGHLLATGFVIATTPGPTLASKTLSCGTTTSLLATATELLPETTYYVRAFAQNEAGITYSEELQFTTISEKDDRSIYRDDFPADENWSNQGWGGGTMQWMGYDSDEDWN